MNRLNPFLVLLSVLCFWGCASKETNPEAKNFSVLEEEKAPESPAQKSAAYEKAMALITSLGYQAVGLELEDDATLDFLYRVFSDSKTHQRKIAFIYTGLQLSYDKDQYSLTFGEDLNLVKTLKFIEKNVPLR